MDHFKVLKDYLFLLLFVENGNDEAGIKDNKKYFLAKAEIQNYNV